MEPVLAVIFVLGLPVWLAVEQIFVLMRSTQPTVHPVTERVAASVAYQSR